jgi:hypothetical protein
MSTYIIHVTNQPEMEWVDRNGETRVVTADSLEEAAEHIYYKDSIEESLYNTLLKDRNAPVPPCFDLLPLNVTITEVQGVAIARTDCDIEQALQVVVNKVHKEMAAAVDDERKAEAEKKKKIDKLKIEAKKLGLTLKDLK